MFAKKVQDIEELKRRVQDITGSIVLEMLRKKGVKVEFRLQTLRTKHREHGKCLVCKNTSRALYVGLNITIK